MCNNYLIDNGNVSGNIYDINKKFICKGKIPSNNVKYYDDLDNVLHCVELRYGTISITNMNTGHSRVICGSNSFKFNKNTDKWILYNNEQMTCDGVDTINIGHNLHSNCIHIYEKYYIVRRNAFFPHIAMEGPFIIQIYSIFGNELMYQCDESDDLSIFYIYDSIFIYRCRTKMFVIDILNHSHNSKFDINWKTDRISFNYETNILSLIDEVYGCIILDEINLSEYRTRDYKLCLPTIII